jgi:hypothetical protein
MKDEESKIVQLMPADGWYAHFKNIDGEKWQTPLIAWGLREDGSVVPLVAALSGEVEAACDCKEFETLWHCYHRETPYVAGPTDEDA